MDRRPLIPALTGIRFLAALAVIVFHLQMVVVYPAILLLLVNQGRLGVDVFFVLSGFVMTYTYDTSIARGRISYRDFLQARFARVFPMHVLALVLLTPLVLVGWQLAGFAVSPLDSLGSWLAALFLLFPLDPHPASRWWNVPAWSLSAEMVFYVLFPIVVRGGLGRMTRLSTIFLTGLAILGAYGLLMIILLPRLGFEFFYYFPISRLPEFLIGALAARYHLSQPDHDPAKVDRVLRWTLLGIWTATLASNAWYPLTQLALAPFAAILLVCLARSRGILASLLGSSAMQRLGEASYGLYLLQYTMFALLVLLGGRFYTNGPDWMQEAAQNHPGPGVSVLVCAIAVGLTIGVSLLTYRFFETPMRRRLRPAAKAPPKQPTASVASSVVGR